MLGLHVVHREHTQKGLGRIDGAMVAMMRRGTRRLTLSVPIRNGSFGPSTDGIFAAMTGMKIGATTTPTASTTTSAVRAMTGSPTQTHPYGERDRIPTLPVCTHSFLLLAKRISAVGAKPLTNSSNGSEPLPDKQRRNCRWCGWRRLRSTHNCGNSMVSLPPSSSPTKS